MNKYKNKYNGVIKEKDISEINKKIISISIIGIITNFLLALFKAIVGLLSGSIAIVLDSINNVTDVASAVVTIIGAKLGMKKPDREHPFGHGRIEYLSALIISIIILYAGFTSTIESVKKIINPGEVDYSTITLVILIAAIVVKFVLGIYVKKKGKEFNSDSLVASGSDAFNDAILSISVLASAIIYMLFDISIEAYVGVLVSVFIIKAGIDLIKESVDNILGVRIESSLARGIKKEVLKEEEVRGAYDLVLHNYGPDTYLGSIHIEVADTLTVADVDRISRSISKNIMKKYGVILHTIGVYSVNTKDKKVMKVQKDIHDIVFSHKGILQMHGFYIDEDEKSISFDIIIDFDIDNREEVYAQIYDEVQEKYKDYKISITLDVDMSD